MRHWIFWISIAAFFASSPCLALTPPVPSPCPLSGNDRAASDWAKELKDGELGRCAYEALRTRTAAELVPIIADILHSAPDSEITELDRAYGLVEALGEKAGELLPLLMDRYRRGDSYQAGQLRKAIAGLGTRALPALPEIIALHRQRAYTTDAALLGEIGKHDPSQVWPYFDELMQKDLEPSDVYQLIEALGEIAKLAPEGSVSRLLSILEGPRLAALQTKYQACHLAGNIVGHFATLGAKASAALPAIQDLARPSGAKKPCGEELRWSALGAVVSIETPERAVEQAIAWVDGPSLDDPQANAIHVLSQRVDAAKLTAPVIVSAMKRPDLSGDQAMMLLRALDWVGDYSLETQRARLALVFAEPPKNIRADQLDSWRTLQRLLKSKLEVPYLGAAIRPDLERLLADPATPARTRVLAQEMLDRLP